MLMTYWSTFDSLFSVLHEVRTSLKFLLPDEFISITLKLDGNPDTNFQESALGRFSLFEC